MMRLRRTTDALARQLPWRAAVASAAALVVLVWLLAFRWSRRAEEDGYSADGGDRDDEEEGEDASPARTRAGAAAPPRTALLPPHNADTFVPADRTAFALAKPLEAHPKYAGGVWCPEKGGGTRNQACSKVSAEYRIRVTTPGKYFLYVEAVAPTIMDNSLWIGRGDVQEGEDELREFAECSSTTLAGPLIPHKHVSSKKKFLCCPAYLAKNAKKGMSAFYSSCCFNGLGPRADETGCAMDLEISDAPRWNQAPRVFSVKDTSRPVLVRVYAREDGTVWTGLVLTRKQAYSDDEVPRPRR